MNKSKIMFEFSKEDYEAILEETHNEGVEEGLKRAMPVVYLLGFAILIIILQSFGVI